MIHHGYGSASMSFSSSDVWKELLDNEELMKSQYELLAGKWATDYNEVVLIVDEDGSISDYTLYTLGILSQDELEKEYKKMLDGEKFEEKSNVSYTYEDLLNLKYKLVLNPEYYQKENGIWIDKSEDEEYMKNIIKNSETIKVVGIIKPNKEGISDSSYGEIGYLSKLKEYVINKTKEAKIVKEQQENSNINIFTGAKFAEDGDKNNSSFNLNTMTDEQKKYYASLSSEELAKIMTAYQENANNTYKGNLRKLGVVNLESPTAINIYPTSFDGKELIAKEIENYNNKMKEESKDENIISYNDIVGTMIKSVSTIVDLISDVLIAFVSISLIVSSIMIGIITYISVIERTKEIGILRAIGASKKDVSRVFKAETFIVGFASGIIGIGLTVLLNIPINAIIYKISGISGIASLPVTGGIILVIISMILTMIAGLIPSKLAAKKDPVEALRVD